MSLPPGQRYIPSMIIYRILGQPTINMDSYRLIIDGEVERPLHLSYSDLLLLKQVKVKWDFHCVTGWSVRDVEWEGVELKTIAELAKPRSNATWLLVESLDKYTTVVLIEDALKSGILALRMNDKELLPEHGFPARLVFKDLYGWKGAKYVYKLTFSTEYVDGYWEKLGYHERGRVHLEERFKY